VHKTFMYRDSGNNLQEEKDFSKPFLESFANLSK
jgi:hypothetical protein